MDADVNLNAYVLDPNFNTSAQNARLVPGFALSEFNPGPPCPGYLNRTNDYMIPAYRHNQEWQGDQYLTPESYLPAGGPCLPAGQPYFPTCWNPPPAGRIHSYPYPILPPPSGYPQQQILPPFPAAPCVNYRHRLHDSSAPQEWLTDRRACKNGSRPHHQKGVSTGDPTDFYKTAKRRCQMAHRAYLTWVHTVYKPTMSPPAFVQQWVFALEDVREIFGRDSIKNIILFNQFLSAVAFNPGAHAWVDSIHIPMDMELPHSIMEQLYADFQAHEARRLHLPAETWNLKLYASHIPDSEWMLRHYCPFHKVLGDHTVDGCSLHPLLRIRVGQPQAIKMDKEQQ